MLALAAASHFALQAGARSGPCAKASPHLVRPWTGQKTHTSPSPAGAYAPALSLSPRACGWGLRYDAEGRITLRGVASEEYVRLRRDPALAQRTPALSATLPVACLGPDPAPVLGPWRCAGQGQP